MVYVTGDTHGDFSRFQSPAAHRLRKGDTLIVLGDFGFLWDGGAKEQQILRKLGKKKYNLLFLDGTHENYDLLKKYPVTDWNGGKVQAIEGNLMHLLRGEIYTIENETYFAFGGGESSDHDLRTDTKTWWEEEMPSEEEMLEGRRNLENHGNKVDFMITHAPSGRACGFMGGRAPHLTGINVYLNLLEDTVTYTRWFFGSLHMDKPMSKRHLAVFQNILPVHTKHAKTRK